MKTILFFIGLIISESAVFCQEMDSAACFRTSFADETEHVFTKMEILPAFVGGEDKLRQQLLAMMNLDNIVSSLTHSTRYFLDTISVKFIINKSGMMSDLSVEGSKNAYISREFLAGFKKTSCHWRPGLSAGRALNGWYHALIAFEVDRRGSFLGIKIAFIKVHG
jgi:hypothetical protein